MEAAAAADLEGVAKAEHQAARTAAADGAAEDSVAAVHASPVPATPQATAVAPENKS